MTVERSDLILVNRYLDDELSEDERELLNRRMQENPVISAYLEDLESLSARSLGLPGWAAPPVEMARKPSPVSLLVHRFEVPVAAVAAAALLLIGIFLGRGPLSGVTPVPESENKVVFRVIHYSPDAKSVSIVGDFNNWSQEIPLRRQENSGYWVNQIQLAPGKYSYSLIIDGKQRVLDPTADYFVDDDFGTKNSIVRVGL